jgi:outer membrane lipoprotein-sorting protein
MRGTAHWEGNSFVNDYDVTTDGKKTPGRDTFTFTPNSHTLVAAIDSGNGTMKTVITTTARRTHKRQVSAGSTGVFACEPGWRCPAGG